MLAQREFIEIMRQYGKAWENLDSDGIVRIFAEDATYQETPFKEPYKGHEEIKRYWENTVKAKEKDVQFTLGSVFLQNNVGAAEWRASFVRRDNGNPEELRGIILAEIQNGKIKKLWEYWHKEEQI